MILVSPASAGANLDLLDTLYAKLGAANEFVAAPQKIFIDADDHIGLCILRHSPTQAADFLQFCDELGNVIFCFSSTGNFTGNAANVTGTVALANGGTGGTTANVARSNLGLGTLATQSASSVAITGGTITGLSSPASGSDAATKSYVDSVAAGLVAHASCKVATTANLNATYSNGTAGVGATLTNAGAQAAFATDGVSPSLNDRILVKNQTTQAENGIYTLTTVGDGSTNWVLTRATDFDAASANEVAAGAYVVVQSGTVGAGTLWIETGIGPFTLGTTAIVFTNLPIGSVSFTFTGNVTGSGSGTVALTIGAGQVTNAMLAGSIDLTTKVTNALPVANGGTGAATLTAHGVLLGEGGAAVVATAAMTDGQLLVGQNGADPSPKTITGDLAIAASGAATIAAGAVTEAKQTLADNTTNNVSTAAHGYAPKLPNDSTKFLNGAGAYTVPPGTGGSSLWLGSFTAPSSGNFSWLNQGTATETAGTHSNLILAIATNDGVKLRGRNKALASANPYTLDAAFVPSLLYLTTGSNAGIYVRNSSSGKIISFSVTGNASGGMLFLIGQWTDANTFTTTVLQAPATLSPFLVWLRIKDDGTNRYYYTSNDGEVWAEVYRETRTTFITPDHCGYWVDSSTTTASRGPVSMSLLHFVES